MTGRVIHRRGTITEADDFAWCVEMIDRRLTFGRDAEHRTHLDRALVEEQVVAVEVDRYVEGALGSADTGHVVDVGVRQKDVANREPSFAGNRKKVGDLVPRIDENGGAGVWTRDHEAVLEERLDRARLDYDHPVILAILDDLMFTSKVKAAAAHLGVPIAFARSSAAALAEMRNSPPKLVILDLNNPRTDPLGTVGHMKADPRLTTIPIVGYASHVQTDVIEAARKAGVDDVLARSAFTQRLPEILARGL
jgi:CheY-like chemotaxis protein